MCARVEGARTFLGRRDSAPLWPAGHLPHGWGDWLSSRLSQIASVTRMAERRKLPISPLEGEMSGRTEGGARERGEASVGSTSSPPAHKHQL
ncbi:MAG: hypothetical protein E5Y06_18165 [Mesorhizobium sp.]|nr:MAG: hypothetical protein E5Y06_18165 [Mesorhizobium sp.]